MKTLSQMQAEWHARYMIERARIEIFALQSEASIYGNDK